jgi:hypothetical protein
MFGNQARFPIQSVSPDRVVGAATVLIGGSGAVTSTTGMPGVTVARTGAGLYSVVFRACPDMIIQYGIQLSTTVFQIVGTARSSSAGTAAFRTNNGGGTATDPASGDQLTIMFYARIGGAT